MARFTYRRFTWAELAAAIGSDDPRMQNVLWRLGIDPERADRLRATPHTPTWLVMCALLLRQSPGAEDITDVSGFFRRHSVKHETLARLLGLNPTTVRRWRPEAGNIPPYIPALFGLLALPNGFARARSIASELIEQDAKRPGVVKPYRRVA